MAGPNDAIKPRTELAERVILALVAVIIVGGAIALWTRHGAAVFISFAQAAWALCF